MNDTDRDTDLERFYRLLDQLAARQCGVRRLGDSASMRWPSHGVYFFYDSAEVREDGNSRVVRVGTHALTVSSRTKLGTRLGQHRGTVTGARTGGGSHRSSIFRHHVGTALLNTGDWPATVAASWRDPRPRPDARLAELPLEQAVSAYIGALPLLCLPVADRQVRGSIERNSIALLSCRGNGPRPPSQRWLGTAADNERIRSSGLWNVNHVDEVHHRSYLDTLEELATTVDTAR